VTINYQEVNPDDLEFIAVAKADEIGNGEKIFLDIDDFPIVLFNIAGRYFAIGDVCSHDGAPVGEGELEDHEIVCPRHGAHFDLTNGKVLSLPAVEDIPSYPVKISDDEILIGIPKR